MKYGSGLCGALLVALTLTFSAALHAAPAGQPEASAVKVEIARLNEHAAEAWKRCRERMLDVLKLEREKQELPPKAWFKRDRGDVDDEIDDLLNEVLDVLQLSALTDYRGDYRELDERIAELEGEVRRLREARITADEKKSVLGFFKLTRKGYTEEIENLQKDIESLETEKEKLVDKLRDEYARMGLQLSGDQVRFYLASVSGRDIMALSAVFDNVRSLNSRLEQLMLENRGDPEAARRYYGIHLVMIHAVLKAHEVTLANIEDRYLKRITELSEQNAAVRKRTDRLLAGAPTGQRRILEASRRAQEVTDKALTVYRRHLEGTRKGLARALEALRTRYDIARNAYDTISISSALAAEMQTALEDLAALRDMHLPELIPFDNEAIQQKFTEITAALESDR